MVQRVNGVGLDVGVAMVKMVVIAVVAYCGIVNVVVMVYCKGSFLIL